MAVLPSGYRHESSPQARCLCRTLRSAELAGLDPAEVAGSAIGSEDLAGARDIASVVDARIRQRVYPLLPQPQGPWAERVPQLPSQRAQAGGSYGPMGAHLNIAECCFLGRVMLDSRHLPTS